MKSPTEDFDTSSLNLDDVAQPILSEAHATQCPRRPAGTLQPDSTCIFLDGLWILRPSAKKIFAITAQIPGHDIQQAIWNDGFQPLQPGTYSVDSSGEANTEKPDTLLGTLSNAMPFLKGVECILEIDKTPPEDLNPPLFLIELEMPDNLYPAALINFRAIDYGGADSTGSFVPPVECATVTIFEYLAPKTLTVSGSSGTTYIGKVDKNQHLHFRVSASDSGMCPEQQLEHIKYASHLLARQLLHQSDKKPVDFQIFPTETDPANELCVNWAMSNVSKNELGKEFREPEFIHLANCAGGQIVGAN